MHRVSSVGFLVRIFGVGCRGACRGACRATYAGARAGVTVRFVLYVPYRRVRGPTLHADHAGTLRGAAPCFHLPWCAGHGAGVGRTHTRRVRLFEHNFNTSKTRRSRETRHDAPAPRAQARPTSQTYGSVSGHLGSPGPHWSRPPAPRWRHGDWRSRAPAELTNACGRPRRCSAASIITGAVR